MKNWQSYITENDELRTAISIMKKIENNGYEAYIVGGSVRDLMMGDLKPHDVDIATNMPMDLLGPIFKIYNIGKSKDFGIVVIKENGFDFEIAQFRCEADYSDGRRPDSVEIVREFKKDVERRDFTINALGINFNGEIIDHFNGKKDIENKILKTVGNPYERFNEDYLRIMRLARFTAKLGFKIDKETRKAARKLSSNINGLAVERIREEIIKSASLGGEKFANYIMILDDLKLLRFVLPEVLNLKYYRENLHHHPETRGYGGSVFGHSIEALKVSDSVNPISIMAILLHDIGKGMTLSHEEGLPRYKRHEKASIDLIDDIADRLKISKEDRESLIFAVKNHMKFHKILEMKSSKIAKLVSDKNWNILVDVGKADEYSRGETFKYAGEFEKIIEKCNEIKNRYEEKQNNNTIKLVDGNDVMKWTGLKSGPEVGEIIKKTTEWIIDNNIEDEKKIEEYIKQFKKE